MLITGFQRLSLIDYPDKVCAIVFTQGCNFRCGFCHNPELVIGRNRERLEERDFFDFLKKRHGKLDAVTITGGEPTLHSDLPEFLKRIRDLDFLVKLDSNGTNPEMLKKIIDKKLVDYLAMDIKAPLEKYEKIICQKIDLKKIKESINLIINSNIDYEFRSTILPTLHNEEDLIQMAELIKGAKNYFLQSFVAAPKLLNPEFKVCKSFSKEQMQNLAKKCGKFVKNCKTR